MSTAVAEMSPVALIGLGSHGAITWFGTAATALLGWRSKDAVGRTLLDVLGVDIADPAKAGSGLSRVRTQVACATGNKLEVEMIVDFESFSYLSSGECVVALVPVVKTSALEAGATPRIDSWSHAAGVIRKIGGMVQCVAIGLEGVEAVNRGYSRSTGDAVLREVALRLDGAVGRRGRVVRVGGNQFALVLPTGADLDVSQLVALVSRPIETRLGTVRIGCYVGSVCGDSASGLVVLDRADMAMRRAQTRGVGAVESWPVDSQQNGSRNSRLSSLLIDAIARREITVTFQPVVELSTGRIIEFEALARWHSSELGEVEPKEFIEAAEATGLIHELGQIVLGKALDVVQAEIVAGRWEGRRVSVNLSAVQLTHPDLPERVMDALSTRCLQGQVLQLEVTGSHLIPDVGFASAHLSELRKSGVRIALDDFGVGCASMSYLRDLPVDAVKIDGQFVAGIFSSRADAAVIRSVVSLAADLRLDVIAEGVETAEQHLALARLGCSAAQGFLYSGDREPPNLYEAVIVPERPPSVSYPYPADEGRRIAALHRADILDTPAEDVYDQIVLAAADLCGTPMALVSLIDEDRQWFKAKVGVGLDESSRDDAFCAHAICSDDLMEVADARLDERFVRNPLVLDNLNVRFYAGAPLRTAAGYSFGTLCVLDTVPRVLTGEQRDGLTRLARQVTVLLELRESVNQLRHTSAELELAHDQRDVVESRLRHQAHYDVLTGLPNRALLMERIETALAASRASGQPLAMLICDVDDFKLVNDGLGHPAGDELLVEVARRLERCIRDTDTVARFGGDEFVLVINNADRNAVALLGERILVEMDAPISLGGRNDLRLSISIGVASRTLGALDSDLQSGADDLLRNADTAMYRAKALGGARMCEFDEALRADVLDRLSITAELRAAVINDELFCLHQPEIDLVTGHLFGLESLVRWRHPTRGILAPNSFVPILEATNGITALFDRVLQLTLEAQASWAAKLGHRPSVAVNLSARQLHDPRLAAKVRSALSRFSVPPESLWLEVTESALASTPTFDTLHEIHQLGVRLAIDDFGVGWSSMARLSMFPWDLLKIDRTFIEPLGHTDSADHVVQGIISLAHSLGMRTSAEGVETIEQLDRLRELGCDIVQGYLIDRPLHAVEATQRMTSVPGSGLTADVIRWDSSLSPLTHDARKAINSSSWE